MVIWHNTGDASRIPVDVRPGDDVVLWIGTYPIELGQSVWVDMKLTKADGRELTLTQPAVWHSNNERHNNSYWMVEIGTFEMGDHLEYRVLGSRGEEQIACNESFAFDVL
jgi:hypothetical protein